MASRNLFWIECNTCPAQGQTLSLTECGHIYCLNCVEKLNILELNNNKCLVCKRSTSYQTLDDTLPSDIKSFFKPWTICSVMETVSNFQKIEKFHQNQIQIFARNSIKKQNLLKKQLQNAQIKIDALLKELSIKNERIKAYQARDNYKTPTRQCPSIAPSANSLKMSTPNSKIFINGILKNNSLNHNTSTPFDRNTTPINAQPTPTPFITPISSHNSADKQRLITNQRQSFENSVRTRTATPRNKTTPTNQRSSHGTAGSSNMRHLFQPSPALVSYRKLIQDRAKVGVGGINKDFLNASYSQSSCSLRLTAAVKSNVDLLSSVSRKRRHVI